METVVEQKSGSGGRARWAQIADRLANEIGAGTYQPGTQLPTEHNLAERFGVNRHTVRRALADLRTRGLLVVQQGRGSFVAEPVIDYPVSAGTRFSENILRSGGLPGGRLLWAREQPAKPAVAEALGLADGAPLMVMRLLRLSDKLPISLATHHMPAARFRGIDDAFSASGSITEALKSFGVMDYRRTRMRVLARVASYEEAPQLEIGADRPVLITESLTVDAAGVPIDLGIATMAADRLQLVVDF